MSERAPQYVTASAQAAEHRRHEENKHRDSANVSHGSNDQEIENLKRLLASISQRLDALKTR